MKNEMNPVIKKILDHPIIKRKEMLKLVLKYQKTGCKQTKDKIVLHNQRLIISVAKKFAEASYFFDIIDLMSYGNMGLLIAIDEFDKKKSDNFPGYAIWWIRKSITQTLAEDSRTIRISRNMVDVIVKLEKVKKVFITKNKRNPSPEELAEITGFDLNKVKKARKVSQPTISLHTPVRNTHSNEEGSELADFIIDETTPLPSKKISDKIMSRYVGQLLVGLKPKEEKVMRMRYGFTNNGEIVSLREVGKKMSVTGEMIRQIQKKALKKLQKRVKNNEEKIQLRMN